MECWRLLVKRTIRINGTDKELEISKSACLKGVEKQMIHLDQLPDGTWRIVYTENTIADLTDVTSFEIIREDDE